MINYAIITYNLSHQFNELQIIFYGNPKAQTVFFQVYIHIEIPTDELKIQEQNRLKKSTCYLEPVMQKNAKNCTRTDIHESFRFAVHSKCFCIEQIG